MKIRNDESGQVVVLTALGMTVLFAFLALALDVGLLYRAKRNVQTVADAAAMGAALDYLYNKDVTKAKAAGAADATRNGVTAAAGGPTVTINCPPTRGPNTGGGLTCNGYFEAVITQPNRTYFLGLFGRTSQTVANRAVAGTPSASKACVYILDPHASDALNLQGSFNVNANSCGIAVSSDSATAIDFTGASGTLSAGSVTVAGGATGHTEDSTPAPQTGVAPFNDPLNLTGPTPGTSDCTITDATGTLNTSKSYSPTTTVCYTSAVNWTGTSGSPTVLGPGTFVFEQGLTVQGNVSTNAATIDIQGGSFTIKTGTVFNLNAPNDSSLPLDGVALMEPASNPGTITIQKGDATGSITGIIYAPTSHLFFQDSGGDKKGGTSTGSLNLTVDLVVGTLFDKTANLTITSYSQTHPTTTPLKNVILVE